MHAGWAPGVNDMERKTIAERLEGNLIEQKPDGQSSAPRCYRVTGAQKGETRRLGQRSQPQHHPGGEAAWPSAA